MCRAVEPAPSALDVTVVIPSYRSSRALHKCLEAVTAQRTRLRFEVIVVHSGTEPVAEDVRSRFATVRFYTIEDRWLPGKARNWALGKACSPWVLFLDSDCVVGVDWMETMVSSAIAQAADGVGGSIRNATSWNVLAWAMHLLEFGEWLPGGRPGFRTNFPSCNALYKRSVLLQNAGFPEDLFPCEDTVLNYVLCKKGYVLWFAPECVAGHIHHKDVVGLIEHNHRHGRAYGQACLTYDLPGRFLLHLNPVLAVLIIVPVRFVRIVLRLICGHLELLPVLFAGTLPMLASLVAWGVGFVEARTRLRSGVWGARA